MYSSYFCKSQKSFEFKKEHFRIEYLHKQKKAQRIPIFIFQLTLTSENLLMFLRWASYLGWLVLASTTAEIRGRTKQSRLDKSRLIIAARYPHTSGPTRIDSDVFVHGITY